MKRFHAFLALFCLSSSSGYALDPGVQKLFGRWASVPASYQLGYHDHASPLRGGSEMAVSQKWLLVGAPESSEGGISSLGAVQVFNAVTGAWVRKLLPPAPQVLKTCFGQSCAIVGDLALIGAPDSSDATPGAVHVYNLVTGLLVRTLKPSLVVASNGDRFGCSVAVAGNRAVIGSCNDDASKGSAYIFDYTTGVNGIQKGKIMDSAGVANDRFGIAVAAEGNVCVVGSPKMDGKGGYLCFDLTTGETLDRRSPVSAVANDSAGHSIALSGGVVVMGAPQMTGTKQGKVFTRNLIGGSERTFTASDGAAGDSLGLSVAVESGLILAGAPENVDGGKAYFFDLNASGSTELRRFSANDALVDAIGGSVAVMGSSVFIAAGEDDTQSNQAGAVLLYKPIFRPMPLAKVTAKGDSAPGAADIYFNLMGDACLNAQSKIAFTSTLTGAGSNASKDVGVWNNLSNPNWLTLIAKSRDQYLSVTLANVKQPLLNNDAYGSFQASLSGAGVTSLNNQAIFLDDGAFITQVFRTGDIVPQFQAVLPTLAGAKPLSFQKVVQSRNGTTNILAGVCSLLQGFNETDATTDSGLFFRDQASAVVKTVREGATVGGKLHGQFMGRISQYDALAVYPVAVVEPPAMNQALLSKSFDAAPVLVSQKGGVIFGADSGVISGVTYSSYIGEGCDDGNVILFRSTIAGAGVTSANNEGLWRYYNSGTKQILRKGIDLGVPTGGYNPPAGLTGVKIAKFIAFWPTFGQHLVLVQLTGAGVSAANDQALLLFQTSGATDQLIVLMREGDHAPGCGSAKIGVINRVEVEPYYGTYLVHTTLTGAAVGTDLALFRGASHAPVSPVTDTLRRPFLILRKGQQFENQPSKVKSFSLPTTHLTAAGAGTTGLGSAVQETNTSTEFKDIALTIEFDNKVRQLMKGSP
jgi:FG-GAP repeat